jgi:hypothetical protein
MRTKTLLIAAAALAVGIISSEAQVYSQNVVGYVNMTIPAGGFQIVGNQLLNGSDAGQVNGDIQTCFATGFLSDANGPLGASGNGDGTNSEFMQWTGLGYNNYYYFNSADATFWENGGGATPVYPAGWYDSISGNPAQVYLTNGLACFIYNASPTKAMTNTFTGTVFQGTRYGVINPNYNLISLQEPVSTNALVAGYGLPPLTSDPNGPLGASGNGDGTNDEYMQWTGLGYNNFYYFNSADATYWENGGGSTPVYPAGFYDSISGNPMPASSSPAVNQGFFLLHFGSSITWTNTFIVPLP